MKLRLTQPRFLLEDENLLLGQLWFGLGDYEKARMYFGLAFYTYVREPSWICQYSYSLVQIQRVKEGEDVLSAGIHEAKFNLYEDE